MSYLPRLPLVVTSVLALAACGQPAREDGGRSDEIRRLEARISELERRAATPAAPASGQGHHAIDPRQQPQTAMDLLTAGNAAFASGRPRPVDTSPGRVRELSSGQKPYAVIVGCADSRTPPEHLFNAGLGDLFVVRCAGNVIDEAALASVEYAVAHLGCRLVVVMGHTACGAVKAGIADAKDTPAVAGLVARIKPAVDEARRTGEGPDLADRAAAANARRQRDSLLADSQLLGGMDRNGELKAVVARYDLADGQVDWLDLDGLVIAGAPSPAPAPAPSRHPAMMAPAAPAPVTAPAHGH